MDRTFDINDAITRFLRVLGLLGAVTSEKVSKENGNRLIASLATYLARQSPLYTVMSLDA
jgi:hypothetical protein